MGSVENVGGGDRAVLEQGLEPTGGFVLFGEGVAIVQDAFEREIGGGLLPDHVWGVGRFFGGGDSTGQVGRVVGEGRFEREKEAAFGLVSIGDDGPGGGRQGVKGETICGVENSLGRGEGSDWGDGEEGEFSMGCHSAEWRKGDCACHLANGYGAGGGIGDWVDEDEAAIRCAVDSLFEAREIVSAWRGGFVWVKWIGIQGSEDVDAGEVGLGGFEPGDDGGRQDLWSRRRGGRRQVSALGRAGQAMGGRRRRERRCRER